MHICIIGYPRLVSDEDFLAVQLQREDKTDYAPCPAGLGPIREKAVCAVCGSRITRDTKSHGRPRWVCPDCGATVHISDERLQEQVSQRLRQLADAPDLLVPPPTPEVSPSADALRIQNELNLCFNRSDINPDYMKTLIFAAAAEQYAVLPDLTPVHDMEVLRDCDRGKIDLVITKSVSRFGRNTLDGLDTVRKLKRKGIGVFFEKENVNTLYMDNEMILTFMMSQAQAESESLSGNVKWGHRKNFKDGKVYYHYASFLGYRKGPDGLPEIDPDEAAIVRRIFSRYLLGQSVRQICRDLMADGVKTAQGSDSWHDSVVRKMLQNEKYTGDALLQKAYTADLFNHERRKNMGELPQYYVHECHPAIIDRDTFQRVQEELARRSSLRKTSSKTKTELGKYCGKYVLSELLVCGECGSPYRRVVWSRPDGKRIVWRCINRLEHGKKVCKKSPTWNEADIHAAVTAAMNELFHAQTAREALEASITAALAGEDGELSLPALEAQIRSLQERQMELFQLAVSAGPDCLDYDEEIQRVNTAKISLMAKKAELEREGRTAAAFDRRMEEITRELEQTAGTITEFDEITVRQLVSNIKVVSEDTLLICFKDGTEITQTMENTGRASA